MAKALKVVAVVAGVVAVVASGGAALGLGLAVGGTIVSAATIATIASVVAAVASLGAQALTKPPPARGSVVQVSRDPNAPSAYPMGEGYLGGAIRHDVGYGATLKKVPNPYRFMVIVYGVAGPMESVSPRVDFQPVDSWFSGFLYTDVQLGAAPEADALAPQWAGAPGWGASSKLSSHAAIGWSFLFDKDGKRFASGLPLLGAYGQWVKVYDPRLDDTQPGGVGPHRLGDESTYEWSENPALHAGMYAYGRYKNGKRVMGVGLPADGIDWLKVMAWANVCDANGWAMFGVVYEGGANESERRWANLKDICFAGGGEPVLSGKLTFKYAAPVVALDTITAADLTDDDQSVTGMQSFADRINTVSPQYVSPDHNWELVNAEDVVNTTFLSEDGEEKREVWPFNFVKNADQAAQLAAYRLFDTREIAPISLVCKPRLRAYRPGECLAINLPELGLSVSPFITLGGETLTLGGEGLTLGADGEVLAVILKRTIDPQTMKVTLELMGETPAKHDYALGLTGTPPPTPALGQTAQERDELAAAAIETEQVTFSDPAPFEVQADSAGSTTTDLSGGDVVRSIRVYKGGVLQTSGVTVDTQVETPDAAIDTTIAVNSGVVDITLDKADATGNIIVPVIFGGVTYDRTVIVNRTTAAPVSGGGGGSATFSDFSWVNISTTSDVQVTDAGAQIDSDASGELQWAFSASYFGSGTAVCKAQYSTDGVSWTDFAAETLGDPAVSGAEPGFILDGAIKTGLTPTTTYFVRLIARRQAGSGTLSWSGPNFTVNQP